MSDNRNGYRQLVLFECKGGHSIIYGLGGPPSSPCADNPSANVVLNAPDIEKGK